jgi:hypothetical protein
VPTPAEALVSAINALLDYCEENRGRFLSPEDLDQIEKLDGAVFALATAANLLPLPTKPSNSQTVRYLGYTGVRYFVVQILDENKGRQLVPRLYPEGQWRQDMRSLRAAASAMAGAREWTAAASAQTDGHADHATDPSQASPPTSALLSASDLARKLGQPVSRVESFLRRYRVKYPDCFHMNDRDDRRRNEPTYLYRTADVLPALRDHVTDG